MDKTRFAFGLVMKNNKQPPIRSNLTSVLYHKTKLLISAHFCSFLCNFQILMIFLGNRMCCRAMLCHLLTVDSSAVISSAI